MSALFSGAPKLPKAPVLRPPKDTALDAEMAALQRRQGSASLQLTGPGGKLAGTPNVLAHQLTGN